MGKSWGQQFCVCSDGTVPAVLTTQNLSEFMMHSTGGRVSWSKSEVSVGKHFGIVNIQEKEAEALLYAHTGLAHRKDVL